MVKRILLAIGIAVAIPAIVTAIALAVSSKIQPAAQVRETPSTVLQNPTGENLGVPAPSSQLQGGTNVQAQ